MAGTINACRHRFGEWTLLGTVESGGREPCHLALDGAGVRLACANHGGGMVRCSGLILEGIADTRVGRDSLGRHIGLSTVAARLYVTNCGHDSVAVRAGVAGGRLSLRQHLPSGGKSPRFLLIAGDAVLIAREESASLSVLKAGTPGTLADYGARRRRSSRRSLDLVTGWGGRIRTSDTRYQKPLPYHLATPQQSRRLYGLRTVVQPSRADLLQCRAGSR